MLLFVAVLCVAAGAILHPDSLPLALLIGMLSLLPPVISGLLTAKGCEVWLPRGSSGLPLAMMLAGGWLWLGSDLHAALMVFLADCGVSRPALLGALFGMMGHVMVAATVAGTFVAAAMWVPELAWVRASRHWAPVIHVLRTGRPLVLAVILVGASARVASSFATELRLASHEWHCAGSTSR